MSSLHFGVLRTKNWDGERGKTGPTENSQKWGILSMIEPCCFLEVKTFKEKYQFILKELIPRGEIVISGTVSVEHVFQLYFCVICAV